MKKFVSTLIISMFAFGCATPTNILPKDYKLPDYQEVHLENGLRVLFIPDKKLPKLSISMMIPTGYVSDPMAKSGLGQMVARMLSKGSTKRKADKIAKELDYKGISFSASVLPEYTMLGISSLSKFQGDLVGLFEELSLNPMFRPDELDRLKKRIVAVVKKEKDEPRTMASRYADQYLYGNHPYAQTANGEVNDISSFTLKDLQAYYQKVYVPQGAVVALVGNYNEEVKKDLMAKFSKWQGKSPAEAVLPKVEEPKGIQVRLVTKASLRQAEVRIVHLGPSRKTEDFMALRLAAGVLGGSFSSRLMDEIRDNLGLTYSIRSRFSFGQNTGEFQIASFTRLDKVGELVTKSLDIYNKMYEDGITEEELLRAKALVLGRFPRSVETSESLASNLMILRLYGISDDYLKEYINSVEGISVSEVNRAIKKHMKPKDLKVLVYAPEFPVKMQLQSIGLLEEKKAH